MKKGKDLTEELNLIGKKLLEELNSGHSENFLEYLKFASKFKKYSFSNRMLIYTQCNHATHVAGFNAWKKLNRSVKKGEKSIKILAPCIRKREDSSGEELTFISGFRAVSVFDISQTEGEDVPCDPIAVNSEDYLENYLNLKARIEEDFGILVLETELRPGLFGTSSGGKIQINTNQSNHDKYLTLIHELAHELLHQGVENKASSLSKAERECQAESTAYIVANYFGIEAPISKDYLLSFGTDEKMFLKNLDSIGKASETIIQLIEKSLEGNNHFEHIQMAA
jgi:hypothetical protein